MEFDTLCKRNVHTRNTCQNTNGFFECAFDTPNDCTVENEFAGCWHKTVDGVTITSCEV